jgi:hypothetical protein
MTMLMLMLMLMPMLMQRRKKDLATDAADCEENKRAFCELWEQSS